MIQNSPKFPGADTQYGFTWGPVEVTRLASDPKAGVFIGIKTPRQSIQIRITPSGLIRINK